MKKYLCLLFCLFCFTNTFAQINDSIAIKEIREYQEKLNADFRNPDESPLTESDFEEFESLDFFPIDLKYRVKAQFIRTPDQEPFLMATTTNVPKTYEKYGEVHFRINGKKLKLNVYQSHELRETEEYRNYLFLPFKDKTNGHETYGGGRYIELWIPDGDSVIVDFNKAYNPYCAYNYSYSCPLVPRENHLPVKIPAGVKDFKK